MCVWVGFCRGGGSSGFYTVRERKCVCVCVGKDPSEGGDSVGLCCYTVKGRKCVYLGA